MITIALGANLPSQYGAPDETILAAIQAIENAGMIVTHRSSIWITAPVPISDQPWYHNAVIAIDTDLSPYGVLESIQNIENDFGRVRSVRNAPRVLDLDLVTYHDTVLDKPELIVPHPRMDIRAFVLLPLQEIAPHWVHPLTGATMDEMIAKLDPDQQAQKMK
jgi:2-amino-4-hydroxy-6-hydroxymethyldihydropteridine diphosphokinase